MELRSRKIIDVRVDDVTTEETIRWIEYFLEKESNLPGIIMTLNPDRFLMARRDQTYKRIVNSAKLVTNDGIGISLAAKILGVPLRTRVTGADLVFRFAELSAKKSYGIYILGARPGIAMEAVQNLSALYPGSKFVGAHHGYFQDGSVEEKVILEEIVQLRPHILILAVGAPREELWFDKHLKKLKIPLGIGVGAGIDFAAGRIKRAPRLVRMFGLEWIIRFVKEPRRLWRRYLIGNLIFMLIIIRHRLFFSNQKGEL